MARPLHTHVHRQALNGDKPCNDFQNGDPEILWRSLTEVLFQLPEETTLWPGHDYKGHTRSSIGEEMRHNPRIAGKTKAQFVQIMNELALPAPKHIEEAVPANRECGQPALT